MDFKKKVLTLAVLSAFSVSAMANTPTNEEIMQMMKEMKEEIAELRKENESLKGEVEDVAGSVGRCCCCNGRSNQGASEAVKQNNDRWLW